MDYELPPLLSDVDSDEGSLSSRAAAGREDSNQAPALISDSSAESGAETPAHNGVQPPARPPSAPTVRSIFDGGLDDIDQSNDEFMDDFFDEEDGGADQLFGPRGLLAGMLQQQEYMQDPVNEGLLQQIPVQNLLEALLNSGQAGLLAGGGAAFALPGMGLGGGRMYYSGHGHLPGVESRIPAGLEGSTRRHAISMAEQGFVTAMDPSRHAACAAEGIPSGRRLMSPRGAMPSSPPAPRQQQRQQQPGATGAARQASGLGGLQRADSALLGGGLQRGDSAASQGMSRVARHAGGARGAPAAAAAAAAGTAVGGGPPALSRLASTARSGAAVGQRAGDGPPGLVSSGSESDHVPGLESASSDGDYEYGPPPLHQQQQGAAASGSHASGGAAASHGSAATRSSAGSNVQERDSYAEPPRRRQRRNAVFGQLPGLGGAAAGRPAAAAAASGSGGGPQLWGSPGVPPLLEGSDSDAEQGPVRSSAGLAPHVRRQQQAARQQRQRSGSGGRATASASSGSEGSPPALESAASDDEQQRRRPPPQLGPQRSSAQLPSSAAAGSRGPRSSSRGGSSSLAGSDEDRPPPLSDAYASDAVSEDAAAVGDEAPALSVGSGSEDSGVPGLLSDAASSTYTSESEVEPARNYHQGLPAQAARAAPAPPPRQSVSEDQRTVMQALTSLLPSQQDAAGWAELATYVRHASGAAAGRRASSGGGVQLLSRLVAAAASRFPAEAEAAGLTERPLAPPPSMAHSAAHSAAATATVSPVGTPAHSVPAAAAAAAAATMAAASGAAAAAAAQRQRAEQPTMQQPAARQRAEPPAVQQPELQLPAALQLPAVEPGFMLPLITFVAETPAAAAALQHELGDAVRVVADGHEAGEEEEEAEQARQQGMGMPPLLTIVTPGGNLPEELQLLPPLFGTTVVTEEDYEAAFEEQEPHMDRQLRYVAAHLQQQPQQAQQQALLAASSAAGASPALLPGLLDAAHIGEVALTSTYTSLLAHMAAMRHQNRSIVANTEAMLRALAASGAGAQPLPPLVAAAMAAAAPPWPQQAEE